MGGAHASRAALAKALAAVLVSMAGLATMAPAGGLRAEPSPACLADDRDHGRMSPSRAVVAVVDAATLRLDDGSELRLAGLLPPHSPGLGSSAGDGGDVWPPEREARAALARLVLGRNIDIVPSGPRADRYGRVNGQAFAGDGAERTWVQGALISGGHARAHALPGQTACLAGLLALERTAREQRRGLWASAAYDVISPYAFRRLWRVRGSYQIVEGRVSAIEQKHGGLVLRLTDRTRLTFRVHVPLGSGRRPDAARIEALLYRRVEARGWIEWRHGPMLTVADPALVVDLPGGRR